MNEKIINSFSKICFLGCNYSLADYDFFDTNHCFPDCGYKWIEDNLKLSKDQVLPKGWDSKDIEDIKWQLERCSIIEKKTHWRHVSPVYIEKHYFGLFHMEEIQFKFYLASWLFNVVNKTHNMPLCTSFFIEKFSSFTFADDAFFDWLSSDQRKTVVQCMRFLGSEWREKLELITIMWSPFLED